MTTTPTTTTSQLNWNRAFSVALTIGYVATYIVALAWEFTHK
jgi:hypothetical protein